MATKKNGERIRLVDYEISMASLILQFFNEKREQLDMTYDELAKSLSIGYSVLYGFLNNPSFYLIHRIDYLVFENMRKELSPTVSEVHDFVVEFQKKPPQSPFFMEKMDYLLKINKSFGNKVISRYQLCDLLWYDYEIDEDETPRTVSELLNLYCML